MSITTQQAPREPTELAIEDFEVPKNPKLWKILESQVDDPNVLLINQLEKMASGSDILKSQFIAMRAIWPRCRNPVTFDMFLLAHGFTENWKEARKLLQNSAEFKNYIEVVRQNLAVQTLHEGQMLWPGSFKPALQYQERVLKSSTVLNKAWEPKEADDETIVVAALLLFLGAVAHLADENAAEWDISHITFKAKFRKAKYKALTDGCLRRVSDNSIRAILEMKKTTRDDDVEAIRLQETAEIVAWIKAKPDSERSGSGRRFLISQDRDEVYITVATYPPQYEKYLGGASPKSAFLKMQTFGPWFTRNSEDVKSFAQAVLTLVLGLSEEE